MTDYEVLLKPKHELLLILNFEEINGNTLKAAVFPKKLFSRYPFKNEYEKPKGYLTYDRIVALNISALFRGINNKYLNQDGEENQNINLYLCEQLNRFQHLFTQR
jgi:hypothetical protein